MTDSTSSTLRCVIGFSYEPVGRKPRAFEPGDTVTRLPQSVVDGLVEQGAVRVEGGDDA